MGTIMYKRELKTRPDGSSYVQCIWVGDQAEILTEDQQLIAAQLKAWNTTE